MITLGMFQMQEIIHSVATLENRLRLARFLSFLIGLFPTFLCLRFMITLGMFQMQEIIHSVATLENRLRLARLQESLNKQNLKKMKQGKRNKYNGHFHPNPTNLTVFAITLSISSLLFIIKISLRKLYKKSYKADRIGREDSLDRDSILIKLKESNP